MARIVPTVILALALALPAGAETFVKEFNSVYGHIIIQRRGSVVEMFATYKGWMARESGIDLDNPSRIIVPYVRYLFAGSVVSPNPSKALVIGLGGGGFNRLFNEVYPDAVLTSVEIDPKVLELAREYMGFAESDKNIVAIRDGRSFVRRSKDQYDWIILDAFHGSVVPPHLKTREFYEELGAHLTPGGVLIANIHDDSELFFYDLATYRAAFRDVVMLKVPDSGNVIVLAANWEPGTIEARLKAFDPDTIANETWHREIDAARFPASIVLFSDDDFKRGRVMTDDFAPAEYFKIIPAAPR
jgi:spermidine synthase